jgi:hypothetical protein
VVRSFRAGATSAAILMATSVAAAAANALATAFAPDPQLAQQLSDASPGALLCLGWTWSNERHESERREGLEHRLRYECDELHSHGLLHLDITYPQMLRDLSAGRAEGADRGLLEPRSVGLVGWLPRARSSATPCTSTPGLAAPGVPAHHENKWRWPLPPPSCSRVPGPVMRTCPRGIEDSRCCLRKSTEADDKA